jgi:hypothetical protein
VFNKFDGTTPLSHMKFGTLHVLVQVHDMPLICMNSEVGSKIGALKR